MNLDMDKYDATGYHKTHLSLFISNVGSMRLIQEQMAKILPRILRGASGHNFTPSIIDYRLEIIYPTDPSPKINYHFFPKDPNSYTKLKFRFTQYNNYTESLKP